MGRGDKSLIAKSRSHDQNQSEILCGASMGRGDQSFIYGKNHSKIFSRTGRPIFMKLDM